MLIPLRFSAAMTALEFVTLLEERNLVPEGLLQQIRRQIQQAPRPIPVEVIIKALVDRGILSELLAQQLLGEWQQKAGTVPADSDSEGDEIELLPRRLQSPRPASAVAASMPTPKPAWRSAMMNWGLIPAIILLTTSSIILRPRTQHRLVRQK